MTAEKFDVGRGTFVLVGCGKSKADEPREARNLYTATYFAKKRAFAEAATAWAGEYSRKRNAWMILSAEHGVLPPCYEVEPYDTTVDDLSGVELDRWASYVGSSLESWLRCPFSAENPQDSPCKQLVVLAGQSYLDPLRERDAFEGSKRGLPAEPEFPFETQDLGGIGEQMAWLDEATAAIQSSPARRSELTAYGGGYERERALWQVNRPEIDVEATEQASLAAFEDVDSAHIRTEQQTLGPAVATDGGTPGAGGGAGE